MRQLGREVYPGLENLSEARAIDFVNREAQVGPQAKKPIRLCRVGFLRMLAL
ncbi:MAG: hypothetical protein DHS20C18_07870 [Saprospiraceae bacterium]|nr:MAG: hypothetical protein DHS20C18_07870 [Saprospiraceae bacterium]